ncbi:MAG: dienelactone hydrolase [Pseudomonadota bacterium]
MFLALALAFTAPQAAPGPVCEATWHDSARNRDMPVRIRMPAGSAKAPVILFSHGLGGNLDAGTDWARAWTEAGFLVVHLQHPGSDLSIWRGGRPAVLAAMAPEQLIARAGDVGFALDHLAVHGKEGACDLARADLAHVGMAGHSYGAMTTQAVSGQRYPGRGSALLDRRIDAAIAFSPSPGRAGGLSDAETFAGIAIPFFSLTGSDDAVPNLTATTPADRERPFRAMPPGGKYLLWFDGTTHAAFSGNDYAPRGPAPDAHVKPIIARATTRFWRWTLMGDARARAELDAGDPALGPKDRFEKR